MAHEIQFWDHSKRLDRFMMHAVAAKVTERPEMMCEIWITIDERRLPDPTKRRPIDLWRELLTLPPKEFVESVLPDSPEATEARKNFPPYFSLTPAERAEVIAASHREVALA